LASWGFYILSIATSLSAATREDIQSFLVDQLGYRLSDILSLEIEAVPIEATEIPVSAVYHDNGFEPLWVDVNGPTFKAAVLLNFLQKASYEGLNHHDYHVSQLEALWDTKDSEKLAKLDILLTSALHDYVSDVREGRVDPCIRDPNLFACARDRNIDPVEMVKQAFSASDFTAFLEAQPPDTPQYRLMRVILDRYRAIEKNGGWPQIPDGESLKTGMRDERVLLLRQHLAVSQDFGFEKSPEDPSLYDESLDWAVRLYQRRHGLKEDGIVGKNTRNAMNTPVSLKIRRIMVNMERLRWISRDLGSFYVLVNIAGFRLSVINDTENVLEMPVIVGKYYRKTPVFSDYIKYIEFNPYWNIPPSIAKKDILPKIVKDPAYLTDMNIRLFEGWSADARELNPEDIDWAVITPSQLSALKLRQEPGPKNMLGRIKFMFPNRFSVYLHDTPSQKLFQRTERAFSSGCIRLSNPIGLSAFLLGGNDNGWDNTKIQEVINNGERHVVRLKSPVPIHIVYLTVFIGSDGAVYFNKDVYGRDKLLEKALFEKSTTE
jgi:murein L,D-transpeptidase YcbB/YkuD